MAGNSDLINGAAIDPAYLIFHKVYVQWWTEGKNPHTPRLAQVQEMLSQMTPTEAQIFVSGARTVGAQGRAMVEFAESVEKMAQTRK
jgi:hypothetical protein